MGAWQTGAVPARHAWSACVLAVCLRLPPNPSKLWLNPPGPRPGGYEFIVTANPATVFDDEDLAIVGGTGQCVRALQGAAGRSSAACPCLPAPA